MLARVSGLLMGQATTPAPPPVPPKPWLADEHRSIDDHYYSEPGPLGLKVRCCFLLLYVYACCNFSERPPAGLSLKIHAVVSWLGCLKLVWKC